VGSKPTGPAFPRNPKIAWKYLYEFQDKICKLALEVITLEDRKNSLLNRREIKTVLKNAAGRIKRTDASDLLAKQLNVDKKTVIPIIMTCQRGKTDIVATFYVYNTEEELKQLPRFRLLRSMPKAERKKLIDEEKAQKLKAKQAAVAETKASATRKGR
jgi:small subunit ribosomal protein S24e